MAAYFGWPGQSPRAPAHSGAARPGHEDFAPATLRWHLVFTSVFDLRGASQSTRSFWTSAQATDAALPFGPRSPSGLRSASSFFGRTPRVKAANGLSAS